MLEQRVSTASEVHHGPAPALLSSRMAPPLQLQASKPVRPEALAIAAVVLRKERVSSLLSMHRIANAFGIVSTCGWKQSL